MNERSRELIGYVDVNSKIRELAERSGCSIDRLGYGEGNLEKFAELIVRECIDVVQRTVDGKPVDDLKEHFGVE